jgi:pimeloyl-ACP methyl ester carboxylesterase
MAMPAGAADQPPTPAGTPADATSPDLAPFYDQALAWSGCQGGLSCAWLTVPLDYADPTGTTIRLRVSKSVASGPAATRQGSLVVNPGGPGATGVDFTGYVALAIASDVATQFDVVGFDTRGVGQSAPVTCMTGRQTTQWLRADPSPRTPLQERRLLALGGRLAQGCLTMSPVIARHLGSDDTVRDLDVLRQALGDSRLNFLGFSYGTYLGTLYAEQFPDRVGRFVLDGALDPSLDAMQTARGQSGGFQVAMTRFAQDCIRHVTCPTRTSARAVLNRVNGLLAGLDVRTMPTTGARRLVQAEAMGALFYSMYSPFLWSSLRYALRQALKGDGTGLQSLADYANGRTGPNSYDSNMASAFPAISCWDNPAPPGAAGLRAAAAEWSRSVAVPDMARAMAWGNGVCSQWFGHGGRGPAPAVTTTTSPILVVGTTFDPATPYPWAVALSKQLATSTLLTYRGDGHTAYGAGSRCIDRAIDAYLLTGAMPPAGTVCR